MTIEVEVDERMGLLTAALLLTDLPQQEQRDHPHKVHSLAKTTATELDHLRAHPCVRSIAAAVERSPFLLIVPHFLRLSWPDLQPRQGRVEPWAEIGALTDESFLHSLRAFRDEVDRTGLWPTTALVWEMLANDLSDVLAERDLTGFLEWFWGDTGRGFVVVPNPLTPRLAWIGLSAPDAHYAVIPPPIIPPNSPEPVAYASRATLIRSVACHELSHSPEYHARQRATHLKPEIAKVIARTPVSENFRRSYPGDVWPFSEILLRAVQILYLRHNEDEGAATALVQRLREREGLSSLTGWVDGLEPYLEGRKAGRYRGWDDYLPLFVGELQD